MWNLPTPVVTNVALTFVDRTPLTFWSDSNIERSRILPEKKLSTNIPPLEPGLSNLDTSLQCARLHHFLPNLSILIPVNSKINSTDLRPMVKFILLLRSLIALIREAWWWIYPFHWSCIEKCLAVQVTCNRNSSLIYTFGKLEGFISR